MQLKYLCAKEKAVSQRVASAFYSKFHRLNVSFAPFSLGRGFGGSETKVCFVWGFIPKSESMLSETLL